MLAMTSNAAVAVRNLVSALEDALLDARIQAGEVRFAFHHRN
jgi:hypothetical protein